MAATLKYTLKQITDISYSGFQFEIPEDTCNIINYLSSQVGSHGINNALFTKTAPVVVENQKEFIPNDNRNKKKRGNKAMEVSESEWETIRTFQTTKIEQKTGIDADMNEIRLYLNKLSDKTFLDMREKIIGKIDALVLENDDYVKLGEMLYELCSTNKFYSKIFADLFAELSSKYAWLNKVFKQHSDKIMEQYTNIKYIDADKDYDGFCEMNKTNEKRKAITTFYMNLAFNGFVQKTKMVKILRDILESITNMINTIDKKNEVDELTEIVGILFNRDMIEELDDEEDDDVDYSELVETITETINNLAQKKAKDYPSLSNKAIFKYMDLVEM